MRIPTTVSAEPHFLDCEWYSTVESTSLIWNHVQTFAFLHNMSEQDDYSKFTKIISVLYIATKFYIKSDVHLEKNPIGILVLDRPYSTELE